MCNPSLIPLYIKPVAARPKAPPATTSGVAAPVTAAPTRPIFRMAALPISRTAPLDNPLGSTSSSI